MGTPPPGGFLPPRVTSTEPCCAPMNRCCPDAWTHRQGVREVAAARARVRHRLALSGDELPHFTVRPVTLDEAGTLFAISIATEERMKILMVITSHDLLGNTDKKTGCWLEEFVMSYYVFTDAGPKSCFSFACRQRVAEYPEKTA